MSSLQEGHSSDEDVASGDVFGLSKLPAVKKARVGAAQQVITAPAAPDVLSEVRVVSPGSLAL
jgi:pre-mRNA-processing factor 17